MVESSLVTVAQMYEEMKSILKHFGLTFHDMDKVQVYIEEGDLVYLYGHQKLTVTYPKEVRGRCAD